ncbi:MAG: hypothetical protein P8Y45_11175 [Exilibacterium sp.]
MLGSNDINIRQNFGTVEHRKMEKSGLLVFKTRIESRLKACKDLAEFRYSTLQCIQNLGFSDFDYQLVLGEGHVNIESDLSTVPNDLLACYVDAQLHKYDMLVDYVLCNENPIFIKTIYEHIASLPFETERIRQNKFVRQLLKRFEYEDSYSMPIHHNDKNSGEKEVFLFSVFCEKKSSECLKALVKRKEEELTCLKDVFYTLWYKKYFKPEGSKPKKAVNLLSTRQTEILQHFAIHGPSSKRVGDLLCRSSRTIEKHAENIRKILNVRTTTEAVVIGINKGLIKPII